MQNQHSYIHIYIQHTYIAIERGSESLQDVRLQNFGSSLPVIWELLRKYLFGGDAVLSEL